MEKVLVTGATGFVGSALVRLLIAKGYVVRCLVRPKADRTNIASLPVEIVTGDLVDAASCVTALAGCQGLFHAAADYRLWVPDSESMFRANVQGTRNIMQAAMSARIRRVVYTSSVATLGLKADGTSADETTPSTYEDMIGPYKQSKFMAEQAVNEIIATGRLPAVIVNPSTPVGPRDIKPTPTGRLILEAMKGHVPFYVGTGLNIVHVDDVANGHLLAYEKGKVGERYILGGDNIELGRLLRVIALAVNKRPPLMELPRGVLVPIAHIAEALARLTKREPFITVDGLKMSAKLMYFSSAKAIAELGYASRRAEIAVRDAISWFKTNRY